MSNDSLWKSCKTCGKKIAVDAKACPQCGSRNSNKGWVKWVAGGFAVLIVVNVIFKEDDKGPTELRDANASVEKSVTDTPKPSAAPLNTPKSQSAFVDIVEGYSSQFPAAKNELQESAMRDERRSSILSTLGSDLSVDNWIGTITSLETNTEGKGIVSIKVSPNVVLKTWNNAISDIVNNTLIEKNSSSYNALLNLAAGDSVVFSGYFFSSDEDGIHEMSVTISGSMQEPEFLFKFNKIEKQ
jgi:RNA polymerase subunit RPABC4/transcription elongation factor Spt4